MEKAYGAEKVDGVLLGMSCILWSIIWMETIIPYLQL